MTITKTYFFEDEEGYDCEATIDLPAKWEICERCHGNGKHDHPAFSNGITSDEWHNDWDIDERESYLRGDYDVRCDDCAGSGKVQVVDEDRLTDAQRVAFTQITQAENEAWRQRVAEEERRRRGIEY